MVLGPFLLRLSRHGPAVNKVLSFLSASHAFGDVDDVGNEWLALAMRMAFAACQRSAFGMVLAPCWFGGKYPEDNEPSDVGPLGTEHLLAPLVV
jgi:hypothetical protein